MTQQDYIALVNQANRASYEYYVLSRPSMSDADFDKLIMYLEGCEYEHPEWIVPDSPTQRVGSDLSANGRRTIAHRTPMLSCQKAQEKDAVISWLNKTVKSVGHNRFSISAEWKYDGISCSLVYLDGQLISASTRGDGQRGQDITAHVRYIAGIPSQLSGVQTSGRIEVRGEIVCPSANLNKLNSCYTDCRTAASSLCNMSEPFSDCALLRFMPWAVDAPCYSQNNSHYEAMSFAKWSLGFDFNLPNVIDANWPEGVLEQIADMEKNRAFLPFPTDGIVLKVDDKTLAASLGSTAHHPHGSIAYKFSAQKAVTTCTRIKVTTGKSGRRTPVAYFSPVTILGREVSRASLYSELNAAKLGITVGSTIEVGLSNDVTPKVYRVISPADNHPSQDGSVCGDIIATTAPAVSVPAGSASGEEALMPAASPAGSVSGGSPDGVAAPYIAPSLFPDYDGIEIPEVKLNLTDINAARAEEETAAIAARLAEPSPASMPAGSTSGEKMETSEGLSLSSAVLSVLAVLGIVILIPAAIAAVAFGFPLLNGSLKA